MGSEQPASFYNEVYAKSTTYTLDPPESPWYPLWSAVDKLIPDNATVFDVGCGPGHMAEILHKRVRAYQGIDFSGRAIQQARKRVPGIAFRWADAFEFKWPDVDVYLFLEVLEHVNSDIALLGKVPTGKRVIITVPRKDSRGHVRYFTSMKSVADRYGSTVETLCITSIEQNWYLLDGVRR